MAHPVKIVDPGTGKLPTEFMWNFALSDEDREMLWNKYKPETIQLKEIRPDPDRANSALHKCYKILVWDGELRCAS